MTTQAAAPVVAPVSTTRDDYSDNNRRWSSGHIRTNPPHDEQGRRAPAITFVVNPYKGRGARKQNNNNPNNSKKYGNQNRNNNTNNNWKRKVKYNTKNAGTSSTLSASSSSSIPKGYLREKITVDYISPGIHGEELYVYTQGKFTSITKPDDQPLILEPSKVVYRSGKKKGQGGEEEEKEVWEKLCAEDKIIVTFNPANWEITEIVSVDDEPPEPETQEWARGLSPPRRRRASWTHNSRAINPRQKEQQQHQHRKQNERRASKGGGSPPEKSRKAAAKQQQDAKRRGSLSSVRELRNAMHVLSNSAPAGGSNANDDFAARMARLEQSNLALQQQLEEAKSKIRLLEEKEQSDKKPSPVL